MAVAIPPRPFRIMLDKGTQNKINACKGLKGKSVADIIATDRFEKNLAAYLTAQKEDRNTSRKSFEAMRKAGGAVGYKLPAHPVDRVMDLSVADFALEYAAIITGTSKRTNAERQYIRQLGQQAYNLTVAQIVCEEFPELESALIPKRNTN